MKCETKSKNIINSTKLYPISLNVGSTSSNTSHMGGHISYLTILYFKSNFNMIGINNTLCYRSINL